MTTDGESTPNPHSDDLYRPPGMPASPPQSMPPSQPPVPPVSQPASSLPAPPPAPPTAPPPPPAAAGPGGTVPPGWTPPAAVPQVGAPVDQTLSTGSIESATPGRSRWLGRGLAVGAAALLMGGGGYLALNAGSADGGADTPDGALDGVLDALSAEDFIGAAEFIEPSERETMIEAGFDVIEELVRLEVFSEDLDLASVDGIDMDFADVEVRSEDVRPGLAHVYVEGGQFTGTVIGSEVPLGDLVTDRVDAETLDVRETETSEMTPSETPIAVVQRDGRWYLSLWYTVAENARIALGEPLPDPSARPAAIGGDTPEDALERMVQAGLTFDLTTAVGLMDPEEVAALYDYAPLFLPDAQRAADDAFDEVRRQGWQWSMDDLQLSSTTDGDLATVLIDGMTFQASGPEGRFDITYSGDSSTIVFEDGQNRMEMVSDLDCVTTTVTDAYGSETDQFCTSDLENVEGFEMLTTGAFANLQQLQTPGMVVHEVDGRWYISPLRSGSQVMIDVLQNIEPEALAETVDALVELARDPFGAGSPFAIQGTTTDPFGDDLFGSDDPFEFDLGDAEDLPSFDTVNPPIDPTETVTPYTDNNIDLLTPAYEFTFVYDLEGDWRDDIWSIWLNGAAIREFDRGVIGDTWVDDASVSVAVVTGLPFASDEELATEVEGTIVIDGDVTYVVAESWSGEYVAARTDDGLVIVGLWLGELETAIDVLRTQLAG